jgi:hypothetical protein
MGCEVPVVEGSRAGVPDSGGVGREIRTRLLSGGHLRRVPVENELSILRQDVIKVPSESARRAFHEVQFTAG